ncbi:MAG: diversity-generating retroelement protein Avd [Verrucomicrobia bacterium]|jgi:hypothetical protein|nr:diversity-generating retroelement protein Avd [Verrucomicrobiota bacterium]
MAESDNVLTKLHDLLVYLVPQLNRFPRDQKFVLGDRIETKLLAVQESCLRAYYGREKRPHLIEANLGLEVTRHLIRLAHALRYFSNHTYGVVSGMVDVVGRMIGGWLKSVSGTTGAPSSTRLSDVADRKSRAQRGASSGPTAGAPSFTRLGVGQAVSQDL